MHNIFLAEICIGSDFFTKARLDAYMECCIDKLFSRIGHKLEISPYYGARELMPTFEEVATAIGTFEWKDTELLWATKW